jgi:hypothetical protein
VVGATVVVMLELLRKNEACRKPEIDERFLVNGFGKAATGLS